MYCTFSGMPKASSYVNLKQFCENSRAVAIAGFLLNQAVNVFSRCEAFWQSFNCLLAFQNLFMLSQVTSKAFVAFCVSMIRSMIGETMHLQYREILKRRKDNKPSNRQVHCSCICSYSTDQITPADESTKNIGVSYHRSL